MLTGEKLRLEQTLQQHQAWLATLQQEKKTTETHLTNERNAGTMLQTQLKVLQEIVALTKRAVLKGNTSSRRALPKSPALRKRALLAVSNEPY
jgi:hypothetical protein